jgi:hypothetical protein
VNIVHICTSVHRGIIADSSKLFGGITSLCIIDTVQIVKIPLDTGGTFVTHSQFGSRLLAFSRFNLLSNLGDSTIWYTV